MVSCRCLWKKHSFHASLCPAVLKQSLLSSPWFGAFKADFPACLLLRRSVFCTDASMSCVIYHISFGIILHCVVLIIVHYSIVRTKHLTYSNCAWKLFWLFVSCSSHSHPQPSAFSLQPQLLLLLLLYVITVSYHYYCYYYCYCDYYYHSSTYIKTTHSRTAGIC